MRHVILVFLVLLLFPFIIKAAQDCICKTPSGSGVPYVIQDSDSLSQQFTAIRDAFMKTVATAPKFNRLEATILIKQKTRKNGQEYWIRGMTTNATGTNYPASCVKLNYMTSSFFYCKQNNLPYDCVDKHVFPMIQYSDNFETGVVVDIITGQPNIMNLTSAEDPRFASFITKRQFTSSILQQFGYLGNQQILSKTYPTNSGGGPLGAEKVLLNIYGRNAMQSCCSALLMMDLIKGGPLMQTVASDDYAPLHSLIEYVKSALFHRRHDGYSPTGDAYPAGTILRSKIGEAYDTLEEIAHITLPNGQEIVFSAYSNAFQRATDDGALTRFADMFLSGLNLLSGIPMFIVDSSNSASFQYQGNWTKVIKDTTHAPDAIGPYYFTSQDTNAQFTWIVNVPEEGLYEVLVFSPSVPNSNTNTLYTIQHQFGVDEISVDMQDYSRWKPVGDFYFTKGTQSMVAVKVSSNTLITVVNALKLSMYPKCNGVIGDFC